MASSRVQLMVDEDLFKDLLNDKPENTTLNEFCKSLIVLGLKKSKKIKNSKKKYKYE